MTTITQNCFFLNHRWKMFFVEQQSSKLSLRGQKPNKKILRLILITAIESQIFTHQIQNRRKWIPEHCRWCLQCWSPFALKYFKGKGKYSGMTCVCVGLYFTYGFMLQLHLLSIQQSPANLLLHCCSLLSLCTRPPPERLLAPGHILHNPLCAPGWLWLPPLDPG